MEVVCPGMKSGAPEEPFQAGRRVRRGVGDAKLGVHPVTPPAVTKPLPWVCPWVCPWFVPDFLCLCELEVSNTGKDHRVFLMPFLLSPGLGNIRIPVVGFVSVQGQGLEAVMLMGPSQMRIFWDAVL